MNSDTTMIMVIFVSLTGFLLAALGIFLILAAFNKSGCLWLFCGILFLIAGMAFCSYNFPAVTTGIVFGALLYAVLRYLKKED